MSIGTPLPLGSTPLNLVEEYFQRAPKDEGGYSSLSLLASALAVRKVENPVEIINALKADRWLGLHGWRLKEGSRADQIKMVKKGETR